MGRTDIQIEKTPSENKFSSEPFHLCVIPLGFKPKTFRTGI